jgi:phosphosulfolactate phosphohydrolase-like enzyme
VVFAASIGAEMSGKSGEAKFSLSPISFLENANNENKNVVLYSPNGATCSELVKEKGIAYIGCLLNAKSIGEQITKIGDFG